MMSRTFAGLLRELNVDVIATSKNRSRAARQTCAGRTLARIFESRGYEHLRSVLAQVRKIVRDEVARRRRSQFKVIK
jgi:molybdopterin biosynthesis enzyme MoaB